LPALFLPHNSRIMHFMKHSLTRRYFLGTALGLAALAALPLPALAEDWVRFNFLRKKGDNFPYKLTEAQWRERLDASSYAALRDGENEIAGTAPLLRERRKGVYACKGCGQSLFHSSAKTLTNDWPTFRKPVSRKAIGLSTDFGIILPRTEVHCANCGGHLGYRFATEEPSSETWRYAINGLSLVFQPA
jgi:peptide-methionine (R)-S-oxide reductase